jgi:gas vesicle protein
MNKALSLAAGFAFGALIGATLVVLFAPVSGSEMVRRVKAGYEETREEARRASEQRRAELEAQFAQMRRRRSANAR